MSSHPTDRPNAAAAGNNDTTTADRPRDLSAADFALMGGNMSNEVGTGSASAPTMTPPTASGTASTGAAGSISGQQITALWSNETNRNSWMYLATAGWKELSNLSDGGSSNLAQLAASARQTGSAPYAFDDATGLITTMYVW